MSSDEQQQIYGRIMSEYLQAKQTLVALQSEATKIAEILASVRQSLTEPLFATGNFESQLENFPTSEKIKALVDEIRKYREKKSEAEKQLRELGFPVMG